MTRHARATMVGLTGFGAAALLAFALADAQRMPLEPSAAGTRGSAPVERHDPGANEAVPSQAEDDVSIDLAAPTGANSAEHGTSRLDQAVSADPERARNPAPAADTTSTPVTGRPLGDGPDLPAPRTLSNGKSIRGY